MIVDNIKEELFSLQDTGYREFQTKLAPTIDPASIIGVRTSALRKMDLWVHNKTIQKAVESRRISPEQKEYLRGLRIRASQVEQKGVTPFDSARPSHA